MVTAEEVARQTAAIEMPVMRRLRLRHTVDDWYVLEIRGKEHVPGYDPEEAGKGVPRQEFRREVLGDWTTRTGKAVYPQFGDIHVAKERLPYDPTLPLICGWDIGPAGKFAFVPTCMWFSRQWLIYPPIVVPEDVNCGIYEFGEWVAEYLQSEFAEPCGLSWRDLKTVHFGDPAGAAPVVQTVTSNPRIEARTVYRVLRDGMQVEAGINPKTWQPEVKELPGFGWNIQPGAVDNATRQEAIRSRLQTILPGGLAALVVDPRASYLLTAFRGGYEYPQRRDGRYELDPTKGWYSHGMNALEYAATRLSRVLNQDNEDLEKERALRERHTTRGAGRRR